MDPFPIFYILFHRVWDMFCWWPLFLVVLKYWRLVISDVLYTRIIGTSSGDEVISLNCGTRSSCNNIVLDDVHLKSSDPMKTSYAHCLNVNGRASNVEPSADQCMHSWATIDLELHRRKELFYFRTQFAHDICWMSHVVNLML